MSESIPSPKGYDWEQERGRPDHLEAVERMGRDSIGDAHPSAATLAQRLAVNPDVLQVFARRHTDGRLEVCGFSLLYPVTDEAGTAIGQGQIRSAKKLGLETLLPGFGDARYLYVGMLLGTPDRAARSHAKTCLRNELTRRLDDGRVRSVFARPATSSGWRLLKSHGFMPIADEDDIWAVSGARLKDSIT